MPRRSLPHRVRRVQSVRDRRFRRPGKGGGPNWLLIGGGLAVIIALGIVFWRYVIPKPADQPSLVEEREPVAEGPPEASATATSVSTPTVTPTPVPQICVVVAATWVRGEPTDQSTGLAQLGPDQEVMVIGEGVEGDNGVWYRLAGYSSNAYVRTIEVDCPGP